MLIDPNAFIIPAIGATSLFLRNYLRSPAFINHDISVFKNFPFAGEGGGRYLQLWLELFNAFNQTQFSAFNSGVRLTTGANVIGNGIFNDCNNLTITNNLRPEGSTLPTGQFFGEYSGARDARIIQLGIKLYF